MIFYVLQFFLLLDFRLRHSNIPFSTMWYKLSDLVTHYYSYGTYRSFISNLFKDHRQLCEAIQRSIVFCTPITNCSSKMPPMQVLTTLSIILLFSQCKTAKMCFLQSEQIWIGCGPTDCTVFVIYEGTLTVCSGGRYLNLGNIHMGGRVGKRKWL